MDGFNRFAARLLAGVSALGAIVPFAAQAQEAPALAPLIRIYASALPAPGLMRAVQPIGDTHRWMTAADFPAAELAARTKGNVIVRVTVDAGGKVTGCTVEEATAPATLQALACTIVTTRGRFRHALSQAGVPVAGETRVHFAFDVMDRSRPMSPPPAPPAPAPGGALATPKLTPLRAPDWERFAPPGKPSGEVAVEFIIYQYPGRPEMRRCYIASSSGDEVLDKATCATLEAGEYAKEGDGSRAELRMLVRWKRGKASFEFPKRDRPTSIVIEGGYAATRISLDPGLVTQSGLVLVTFNPDRSVVCSIERSTGSDAADIAICQHFRTKVKFTPAIDIYGRRVPARRGFTYDK